MKKLSYILVIFFLTICVVNAQTVKVGTSSFYPFSYQENDEVKGFDIEVWEEIAKRIGVDVEFSIIRWTALFGMLETNRIDTIANQITITDERKKKYNFSIPYVYDGAQIAVHKDDDRIKSIDDLKGKTVAVVLGSNFEELLRKIDKERFGGGGINIKTYDEGSPIEMEVALRRVDAYVRDIVSSVVAIKERELPLKIAINSIETISNAYPFLKNKKGDELLNKVNKAIKEMRDDGTLKRVSLKWFNRDITNVY